MRKLCASCRFDKCLKMGMRESAVLSRLAQKNQNYKKPDSSPPDDCTDSPSTSEATSLLERLQNAYQSLENARKKSFCIEEGHVPKLCNYKQMNDVFFRDVKLVMDNLIPLFTDDSDSKITKEQLKLLLVHFMVPFILLEGGFKSASESLPGITHVLKISDSELFILPSGDYIDQNKIEEYYRNPEDLNDDGKAAAEVFKPYWKLHRQSLKSHLDDVQLDLPEFLFVTALIFWDFGESGFWVREFSIIIPGLQDQSDECIEVCKQMRSKIFEELTDYEKNVRINEDHSYRVGQIVIVLQVIQRTLNMMQETREISLVYNLYERHCSIFEAM